MALTIPKLLSGSTNGRMIKVVAVATAGTLIHTAVAGVVDFDELWLYACNTDASARLLTIEWGGVAAPDDTIEVELAANSGLVLIVPGLRLQNGLVVRAFAAAANVVLVGGNVNTLDL
jgi:hypothetical protein